MINLGIPIKKYRMQKRIRQTDLAEKIEVTPTYISALENNRKVPSMALITKICDVLNVSKEILFWEAITTSIEAKPEDKEILEVASSIVNEYYNQKI